MATENTFMVEPGPIDDRFHLTVTSQLGAKEEIVRTIILFSDDLDKSNFFSRSVWNASQRIFGHIVDKIITPPKDPAQLAAWYASIEIVSWMLSSSYPVLRGPVQFSWTELQEALANVSSRMNERLSTSVGTSLESFLIGELQRHKADPERARAYLKVQTIRYLRDECGCSKDTVDAADAYLEELKEERLEESAKWIDSNPNYFWHAWSSYFRNLADRFPTELPKDRARSYLFQG